MTDRPVIFSAPMVRALLDDRKTMTRRLAWREFTRTTLKSRAAMRSTVYRDGTWWEPSPWQKVQAGDRLWARETHYVWSAGNKDGGGKRISYRATEPDTPTTWMPSIHMPRWASRLTLIVTATNIERLQDISGEDARAEGIPTHVAEHTFRKCYRDDAERVAKRVEYFSALWATLHGVGSWDANPEVVALTFTVHKTNIDQMERAV